MTDQRERPTPRCTQQVARGDWNYGRCSNKAAWDPGPDGIPTRCGIHSAASAKSRRDKYEAKQAALNAQWEARNKQAAENQRKLDSHAALVEALTACVRVLMRVGDGKNEHSADASTAYHLARAALRLATEGETT